MNRLLATARADVRLQVRNGFYYAVAFVLVIWAIVVAQLSIRWAPWLAAIVLGNLMVATFYFIGGLVLLEKAEGTLEAQVVTPLRTGEYLWSKVLTLTALSLAENLTLVTLATGFAYHVVLLITGIGCAAVIYTLIGFVAVARYDSINEYLMPSMLYVTLLSVPFLDYFELWRTEWMILHPLQGSLVVMKSAFVPVEPTAIAWGLGSAAAWIAVAYGLAHRAFRRFLIRKEGVR